MQRLHCFASKLWGPLLLFLATCAEKDPILVDELLYVSTSCSSSSEHVCTGTGNLVIPVNIDLMDQELTNIKIDSVYFAINFLEVSSTNLYSVVFSFGTQHSYQFSIPLPDQDYTNGEVVTLNFTSDQIKWLSDTFLRNQSVIISFGLLSNVSSLVVNMKAHVRLTYQ